MRRRRWRETPRYRKTFVLFKWQLEEEVGEETQETSGSERKRQREKEIESEEGKEEGEGGQRNHLLGDCR